MSGKKTMEERAKELGDVLFEAMKKPDDDPELVKANERKARRDSVSLRKFYLKTGQRKRPAK